MKKSSIEHEVEKLPQELAAVAFFALGFLTGRFIGRRR
jgi:hypothetical protein